MEYKDEAEGDSGESSGRLAGIDWLRSLAISGVTIFHVFPALAPGGFLGVNIFFILSGFLAAYSGARLLEGDGPFYFGSYLWDYYRRRLGRIYPSLIIVVLATLGACQLAAPRLLRGMGPEVLSIFGGYNNFWQVAQNADYFTRLTGADPFTHMWFLGIELQFCLIFPFIFFLYRGIAEGCGRKAGALLLALVGLVLAGYIPKAFAAGPGQDVTALYYGTAGRIYDLLLGAALGFYRGAGELLPCSPENDHRRNPSWLAALAYGLLVALTLGAFALVDGSGPFLYQGGMGALSGAFCLLVWLTVRERQPLGGFFENGITRFLGKYSYGIFLWQYPVIVLAPQLGLKAEAAGTWAAGAGEIGAMIGLAALTDRAERGLSGILVRKNSEKSRIIEKLAAVAAAVMMAVGAYGLALAPWQRAADTEDLRAKMADNAALLRQQKPGQTVGAADSKEEEKQPGAEDGLEKSHQAHETGQPDKLGRTPEAAPAPAEKKPTGAVGLAEPGEGAAIPSGIICIGDSVMLGSARAIKRALPDCYIDADVCRYVGGGIPVAEELLAAGKLGDIVVVALGTNGPISGAERYEEQTVALLELLKDRRVFWVNTYGADIDWIKPNNDYIAALPGRWPNVRVVDWHGRVSGHPEWLSGDGVHPNDDGVEQYASLLREAIEGELGRQNKTR